MTRSQHVFPADSPTGEPLTQLRTAVNRYLKDRHQLGELSILSVRQQRSILGLFAEHVGPEMAVGRLARKHVEHWLIDMHVGNSTLYTRLCTLRAFTKWCAEHGYVKTDACMGIRGPRRPKGLPRAVTTDDMTRLLSVLDARMTVCVLLGAQEGLRRAEITRLSTSDVDLDKMLLRVLGKGDKERWVPLSPETAKAIDDYLTEYPAGPYKPLIRSYTRPDRGVRPEQVGMLTSAAMMIVGIKRKPWDGKSTHALRHTCANDMLEHGADIRDVQEMLGHEHMATTTIYLRRAVAMGRLRDAAAGRSYVGE